MLQDWYQPQRGMVWPEQKVFGKLNKLKLAPDQQSMVDSGVRVDQFALGRSHSQQPFNDPRRRLIFSIRQESTILMANGDQVADHCLTIDQALIRANKEAFLPVNKRDPFNLDPPGELDLAFQGLIFPECSPESPDLEYIMGDSVDPDTKERIMNTVNQSLASNRNKVKVLD